MFERFDRNDQGVDYVVGDLHGHFDLLMAALDDVDFDRTRDRLFCVGDLIDRGPRSFDCLKLVLEPWFHSVRGNHEEMAFDAIFKQQWRMWLPNGGTWAGEVNPRELKELLERALPRLPLAMEVAVGDQRVGIVHAQPPSDWRLLERGIDKYREALLWARTRISREDRTPVEGIDAVVVGHTPVERPRLLGNVHYIDTGAYKSGVLTLAPLASLPGV
ncbi:metallophosphoesterase [Halotalea alkalilenta]|uniref:metallophosphoesterase n=1 Tax=Halotalea alkalilenta TaxID=376489 RepID=UPI0005BC0346|nr:metallophosphoesterase [Halotalea alkalilenta]